MLTATPPRGAGLMLSNRRRPPRRGSYCPRCGRRHRAGAPAAVVARCDGELAHRPRITWRAAA